ncbi:MAG TPA: Fe-S-containing protein, partial [Thermoanaerobaculia bacterium]|nr:Fe-S-containing protein [Thermoanaerobaculia bacterium]
MFEALVVTLREGIEAALMVGIIVAFLRKQASERYLPAVWTGLVAAVAASLAGAFLLYRIAVNEEVFEGLLYVISAVLVATLLVWMWRHSSELAGEMKGSLTKILARGQGGSGRSVWLGLFLFTFVMVFREGIETVLFLSAVSLTTTGLLSFLGALLGLAAAVAFGVLFVRGSLRIDLKRFFTVTGIALLIFTVQLLVNGYHELSEAGWVPANQTTMATIGPLVKNEFFFLTAVLALPLLMLLVPGSKGRQAPTPPAAAGGATAVGAERRLERATERRQGRARVFAGALGLAILAVLGLGFVYSEKPVALSRATPLAVTDGAVRIPLSALADTKLHRYSAEIAGASVRFIAIQVKPGDVATAFDACLICGPKGYYQDGSN